MASFNPIMKKSSYKDISKDSDKIGLSTKDYHLSSSDDHLKCQQEKFHYPNCNSLQNNQANHFNDNATQEGAKDSFQQIMRRVISLKKPFTINNESINYSNPALSDMVSKKIKNRLDIKPISEMQMKYNSTSIRLTPMPCKENGNDDHESIGLMTQRKDGNSNLIEKDYSIGPVKYNPNMFQQSKVIASTNSSSQNGKIEVFKRKHEACQVSNIDLEFSSHNSSTSEIINERIKPVAIRKSNDNKNKKEKEKVKYALYYNNNYSQSKEGKICPIKGSDQIKIVDINNNNQHHIQHNKQNKDIHMKPLNFNNLRFLFNKPECFQFFGSNATRELLFNKQKFDSPGPGEYFNSQSDRIRPIIRIMKKAEKNSGAQNINHANLESDMMNTLGPGSYDIKSTFVKKNTSNVDSFGSCERRFVQSVYLDHPGPGEYYNENNQLLIRKNKSYTSRELNSIQKEVEQATINFIKQNTLNKPPHQIGQYSPEKYNSIEYKIKSKLNNANHKTANAPFSSKEKRFNTSSKDKRDFGVLQSDFDKQKTHNCKSIPFLFSHTREKDDSNTSNKLFPLPGQINKDSYFDWNKKSYNIKYL